MGKEHSRQPLLNYIEGRITHYTRGFADSQKLDGHERALLTSVVLDIYTTQSFEGFLALGAEIDARNAEIRGYQPISPTLEEACQVAEQNQGSRTTAQVVEDLKSRHKIADKLGVARLRFSPHVYVLSGFCEKILHELGGDAVNTRPTTTIIPGPAL